jgi:hypothetical protein
MGGFLGCCQNVQLFWTVPENPSLFLASCKVVWVGWLVFGGMGGVHQEDPSATSAKYCIL